MLDQKFTAEALSKQETSILIYYKNNEEDYNDKDVAIACKEWMFIDHCMKSRIELTKVFVKLS